MKFTKDQTEFIFKEFGKKFPADQEIEINHAEWMDLKEKVLQIEIEEARPDGVMNKRCRLAVEIGDMRYQN